MINKLKVLCIVPCRFNSKRIKNKNFLPYKNLPLFQHTLKNALRSKYIDEIVLSTDSKKIFDFKISKKVKIHLRDKNSKLYKKTVDQIALNILNNNNNYKIYDILIILYPTSPLRTTKDIHKVLHNLVKSKKKYSMAVTNFIQPINQCLKITKISTKAIFEKNYYSDPPKDVYVDNGSTYAVYLKEFYKSKKSINIKSAFHVMDYKNSIDINNFQDYLYLKSIK